MLPTFLERSQSISLAPFDEGLFWLLNLEQIEKKETEEARDFLDDAALNRSERLRFEEDRSKEIITQAALRFYLAKMTNQKPRDIEILRNAYGKPFLQNHPLHFNLSHSKYYAFIGCHPHKPIGVDIEPIRNISDMLKVSDSFLHPSEKEQLLDNCSFFSLWCAKEAILKAKGTGFSTDSLPVLHPVKQANSLSIDHYTSMGMKVCVYNDKIKDHKLAVCI